MATSLPSEPTRQADYRVKPQRNLNEDDANGRMEYGGEGGIRTPDSLATMPDFESGAFNRALPPLREINHSLQMASAHTHPASRLYQTTLGDLL